MFIGKGAAVMKRDIRKGLQRNKFVYTSLRILFGWFVRILRCFSYEKNKTKSETALILSNHNSDWDPLLMVIAMKRHMKFVASANILTGFTGKLISFLAGPIPRAKGASADDTVELIRRNLKAGISVAMFAEGNKSWDGETGFISERTAELLKDNTCGLITWRFEGDYLQTPRWAKYKRRGPVRGKVIREYLPEELQNMSVNEIYAAIIRDLHTNAFDYEKAHPKFRYRGKNKAEGFENLAYLCPNCLRFGTIRTNGDTISCVCGLKKLYREDGFLEDIGDTRDHTDGTGKPIREAFSWNAFQKAYLTTHTGELKARLRTPFRTDSDVTLFRMDGDRKIPIIISGKMMTFGDRIEVTGDKDKSEMVYCFPFCDITRMGMFRNTAVYISLGEERYKIEREAGISGIFYFSVWRVLTGKSYY